MSKNDIMPTMVKDPTSGLFFNSITKLVPVTCVKPTPEKGWSRGDTFGVEIGAAVHLIAKSIVVPHALAKGEKTDKAPVNAAA